MNLGLLVVAWHILVSHNIEWDLVPDLFATPVADTAAVSGSCNDTPVTAFVPNLDYTVSFSAPAAASGPTCSTSLSLSQPINGDTAPSISCSLSDQVGFAVFSSRSPTMKIGGLACVTEDRSKLEVYGDGSDNISIDIAISPTSASNWTEGHKVDQTTSSNKVTLFGSSGQVDTNTIIDGQDNDGLTNGEVTFGGTTTSEGASEVYIKLDVTNYNVQTATDKETLTYVFTPQ